MAAVLRLFCDPSRWRIRSPTSAVLVSGDESNGDLGVGDYLADRLQENFDKRDKKKHR
jgi:hypothetical protein